jgi:poly(hydroxyalkanoate) depolymerase family esterase
MTNTKIAGRMAVAMRLLREARPDGARLATGAIQETLRTLTRDRVGVQDAAHSDVDQRQSQRTPVIRAFVDGFPVVSLGDLRIPLGPRTVPVIGHKLRPTPSREPHPGWPGRFIDGSYENSFGARTYKLYIPTSFCGQALPLLVMLHGCTQDSIDFALGTRMNEIGEENGCFVLYPSQAQFANTSKCWNWFRTSDQRRDQGEPSILAEMTREIVKTFHNDKSKVFVAGMSSGGAMAMILAATYPDLFAAAGIHSGLPYGAAHDLPSALAAMRQGAMVGAPCTDRIPVIVFHGDQDKTVHPRNGAQIVAQSRPRSRGAQPEGCSTQQHTVPGGRTYSRTVYRDTPGRTVAEYWVIENAGHAWSGGSTRGSHTDPKGPDASCAMMRFFLALEKSRGT